ncbi:hypothetical protein ACHAQA_006550 [Verticillium albo-atrum]
MPRTWEDIPARVRHRIYDLVFTQRRPSVVEHLNGPPIAQSTGVNLLLVNHQVYYEAVGLYFQRHTLVMRNHEEAVTCYRGPSRLANRPRRVVRARTCFCLFANVATDHITARWIVHLRIVTLSDVQPENVSLLGGWSTTLWRELVSLETFVYDQWLNLTVTFPHTTWYRDLPRLRYITVARPWEHGNLHSTITIPGCPPVAYTEVLFTTQRFRLDSGIFIPHINAHWLCLNMGLVDYEDVPRPLRDYEGIFRYMSCIGRYCRLNWSQCPVWGVQVDLVDVIHLS